MITARKSTDGIREELIRFMNSEEDLYRMYIPNIEFDKLISSPLRVDNNPSFIIRRLEDHTYWCDYATGEFGGVTSFLKKYLGADLSTHELVLRVQKDLKEAEIVKTGDYVPRLPSRTICKIHIKKREFTDGDIEYWNSYGISKNTLRLFKVYPISHYWLNGNKFTCRVPTYAYNLNGKFKLYAPTRDKFRFMTSTSHIQGIDLLPQRHDTLIIQKSYKDVMLMYEFGFPSIAPQSELNVLSDKVCSDLSNRFNNIYIFYDYDDAGKIGSECLSSLISKSIPLFIKDSSAKDCTDYCRMFGKSETKELLNNML